MSSVEEDYDDDGRGRGGGGGGSSDGGENVVAPSRKHKGGKKGGGSKRRRIEGASFLDTMAQVGSEDEEEEYEYEDLGEAEEAAKVERELRGSAGASEVAEGGRQRLGGAGHLASAISGLEKRFQSQLFDEGEGGEAMPGEHGVGGEGKRMMAGVEEYDEVEDEEYDDMMEEDAMYQGDLSRILPASTNIKLWKVNLIRGGRERDTCVEIMRRFANLGRGERANFPILAVFAPESLRGALYVESASYQHVVEHLRGISNVLLNRQNVTLVPHRELPDIFGSPDSRTAEIPERGRWVRFARGLYAGDIALVCDTDGSANSITVRVVPRIDLNYEKQVQNALQRGLDAKSVVAPRQRPGPNLIFRRELEQRGFEVEDQPSGYLEACRFRKYLIEGNTGYLIKTAKISQFELDSRFDPTSEEIAHFAQGQNLEDLFPDLGPGWVEAAATGVGRPASAGVKGVALEVGQRVWVVRGDLKGLPGIVCAMESDGNISIQPEDPTLLPIVVSAADVAKRFRPGESVRVVGGPHEGDIGLIVKIDTNSNVASILSIESQQQITCKLEHLTWSPNDALTPAGLTKVDGYSVNDLVQITPSLDVGVIVKIGKTKHLDILTKDGLRSYHVSQLGGKKSLRLSHALDSAAQQFGVKASVEVGSGPHRGKKGKVSHIWRDSIFIQVPGIASDGGYICAPAQTLRVLGLSEDDLAAGRGLPGGNEAGGVAASAGPAGHHHPGGGPGGRGGGMMGRGGMMLSVRARFALMGTPCKIIGGPQKGLLGELRSIQGPDATVLVASLGREVRLPRQYIQLQREIESGGGGLNRLFARPAGMFYGDRGGGGRRGGGGPRDWQGNNHRAAATAVGGRRY